MEADLGSEQYWASLQSGLAEDQVLVTDSGQGPWGQVVLMRDQLLFADEPEALGGRNTGPRPTDMVLMALGSCTAITVRMYAARKGWTIDRMAVRLRYDPADPAVPDFKRIERLIDIDGPLDAEQRGRLMQIAEKCPVHRILTEGASVRTAAASGSS
jgi:putative redox protein